MKQMSKGLSLLVAFILIVSGLIIVESTSAQSIYKPSTPEFTLGYADNSYDVPPSTSTSTNPYTGQKTNTTIPGYHVDNKTIELTIKNQPFTSYESNGQIINFYFNVRSKGHFAQNWTTLYSPDNGYVTEDPTSGYTKISYILGEDFPFASGYDLNQGGQVDFQVEALIGFVARDASTFWAPWGFNGETSSWSNTQTLKIPETSPSPSSNPTLTPTPTVPEFTTAIILPLFGVVALIAKVQLGKKHRPNAHN
jgi:hypothetical protein